MSNSITLSSATRQNLLSLQGTADLLATTQNRLATGKKVNSALDNPTNFFTADGLSSRSKSLSSLLDGISNGIQTIQAANTGLTKLQGLTDQLKSVAQQAMASANAFTSKAAMSSTNLTGANAGNLLSVGATIANSDAAIGASSGGASKTIIGTVDLSDKTKIDAALFGSTTATLSIDGVTINLTKDVDDTNLDTLATSIGNQLKAGGSSVTVGKDGTNKYLVLTGTSDGGAFSIVGSSGQTAAAFGGTPGGVAGTFAPTATTLATGLGFAANDSFTVNGQSVTVSRTDTLSSLAQKVSVATNGTVSAAWDATNRVFKFTAADSATAVKLGNGSTTTSQVSNLGFTTTSFGAGQGSTTGATFTKSALDGKSITVQVGSGPSISVAFGNADGQVNTLTKLNAALASANAQAGIDSTTGKLTITPTNDNGADTLTISNVTAGAPFAAGAAAAIIGGDGANARTSFVGTYNGLLAQVNQLASDAGFNGLNLLAGDSLKVVFNERGSSLLSVQGSTVTAASLGLGPIDPNGFQENASINKAILMINSASSQLKAQASSLGSNLAVVQNRQDFTKQIVNVLDTGAGNLVNADLNEEAANSQALSTRNSLGISALSLANQAQQGVLQLLR